MARYEITTSATTMAASTTAASAGLLKVDESGTTAVRAAVTRFAVFAQGNANDNQYVIRVKRQTGAGTWTSVTPAPLNIGYAAANSVGGIVSTAAGAASTVLMTLGYNYRAGMIWVAADDDGVIIVPATANNGVILEWVFAQGSDVHGGTLEFEE